MSTPIATRARSTLAFYTDVAKQIDEYCYNFTPKDFIDVADAHGIYLVDDDYDIDIDTDDNRLRRAIVEVMEAPVITAQCVAEALTDNTIATRWV